MGRRGGIDWPVPRMTSVPISTTEGWYQHLVEASPSALLVVDRSRTILLVNRATEQLFGYERDELLGKPVEILIPERFRDQHPAHIERFFGEPQARAMGMGRDLYGLRKDGTELPVEIGLSPMQTSEGLLVAASFVDISERKRNEDSLRRSHVELEAIGRSLERQVVERTALHDASERHLKTILDALPSMVGYWDEDLINRFANEAYRSWFGVGGSNLKGRHMRELLGPDIFELNRPYAEAALRGEPQTFERAIPRPEGGGVRHSLAHYLPDSVDGKVRGFHVLVHDVTEIVESRLKLAGAVKEREVMLQEIHHRVKNNLQIISSLLNMQLRRLEPGGARDAVEDCRRRVLVIAQIHERLYLSKDYVHIQLGELIKPLVSDLFSSVVVHPGIRFELAIDEVSLDLARAIPCALLINELVTNALKHAFRGRPAGTVRVAFRRRGPGLELEVADDGCGLPDGLDITRASSMGAQLIVALAAQLGGVLAID